MVGGGASILVLNLIAFVFSTTWSGLDKGNKFALFTFKNQRLYVPIPFPPEGSSPISSTRGGDCLGTTKGINFHVTEECNLYAWGPIYGFEHRMSIFNTFT